MNHVYVMTAAMNTDRDLEPDVSLFVGRRLVENSVPLLLLPVKYHSLGGYMSPTFTQCRYLLRGPITTHHRRHLICHHHLHQQTVHELPSNRQQCHKIVTHN